MRTMPVSQFRAKASAAIERVTRTGEGLVVTKRGVPVAQVIPFCSPPADAAPGGLAHTLVFEKDIVSPLGREAWVAAR